MTNKHTYNQSGKFSTANLKLDYLQSSKTQANSCHPPTGSIGQRRAAWLLSNAKMQILRAVEWCAKNKTATHAVLLQADCN